MTEPPRRRPFRGAGWRAARGGVRHHPAPVPCRVLDQNEDDVPGRMGGEMPIRVPHHPRDQGGVYVRELMRKTLCYMINRGAFGSEFITSSVQARWTAVASAAGCVAEGRLLGHCWPRSAAEPTDLCSPTWPTSAATRQGSSRHDGSSPTGQPLWAVRH